MESEILATRGLFELPKFISLFDSFRKCFILVGHVYITAILEVILSRCLIFSYLSLFILWFNFRIPHPIPHPYTDASHIYSRNLFSYYLYLYFPPIYFRFLCIIYVFLYEFRAFQKVKHHEHQLIWISILGTSWYRFHNISREQKSEISGNNIFSPNSVGHWIFYVQRDGPILNVRYCFMVSTQTLIFVK